MQIAIKVKRLIIKVMFKIKIIRKAPEEVYYQSKESTSIYKHNKEKTHLYYINLFDEVSHMEYTNTEWLIENYLIIDSASKVIPKILKEYKCSNLD